MLSRMERALLGASLGALTGLGLPALAGAAAAPVAISPAPGTPDASPQTQISILGVDPHRIRAVQVTGSATGAHRGVLRTYSGDRGASYVLTRAFAPGEDVRVLVRIAGMAPRRSSFAIARLDRVPPILSIPVEQPAKLDHFVSRPDLLAPRISVTQGQRSSGGDIFLAPTPSPVVHPQSNNAITIKPVGPGGPMIVDPRGNLVWFDQLQPPVYALNFTKQRYAGRDVLTWWQGTVTVDAFGIGEGVIAGASYRTLRTVHAGNGYAADLHEFALTQSGDALLTVYVPVLVHLPGTSAGTLSPVLDALVQEVDIRTGLVVWEWHALGHVPLRDSYATPANSADYDAFHINSIQALRGNRVLVSARDTSAVYLVDRTSGKIVWTLGGKASSFRLARGARFYFQHDARMLHGGRIQLFDDEAGPPFEAPSSRGLILSLDRRRRIARVSRQYRRPQDTLAQSEGSVQQLRGGDVFVGFGSTEFFSEFSPAGGLLFDGSLPADDGSYRVFRFPWHATPRTRPTLVARRTEPGTVTLYVSWNGATEVRRWQLLSGTSSQAVRPAATVGRRGFETVIPFSGSATAFAVRALDAHGHVLGTSRMVGAA